MRVISTLTVASFAFASFLCGPSLTAQTKPASPAAEKSVTLPVREIALYKNGVGFFEQTGTVSGDALIQIDFTTAQLNDVLQSLTAVDLGGGRIIGLNYDSSATLQQQLDQLHLGLGEDPTVMEFLHAIKGTKVEVRGNGPVVTGKLLNVEVRSFRDLKTGEPVERRFVSVVTDAGSLRSIELTPSVEVRMLGTAQRQEIGRYLQILATTHDPELRHLTLEDRGTGERQVQISYIGALPAWKSSYRILLTNDAKEPKQTATLQEWALVDNTSAEDWKDVQLTLVSGAPQSFIQQISRPNNIARPEIPLQGGPIPAQHRPLDPMGGIAGSAIPINASAMGGGAGMLVSTAKAPQAPAAALDQIAPAQDYQQEAKNSLAPQITSEDFDDMFEYKLSKPMTIHSNESAVIPILQTTLDAERVSIWRQGRGQGKGVERALWLSNASNLTFDEGSFSIVENGIFAGQGEIALMHPGQRNLLVYGTDDAVRVDGQKPTNPAPVVYHINIANGVLSIHRQLQLEHDFNIQNTGTSARTVLIEMPQSDPNPRMGAWVLSKKTPADETLGDNPKGKLYRFAVPVEANSTKAFQVIEQHSHPFHSSLASMSEADLTGVMKESGNNPEVVAKLQPIVDAKHKLADLNSQLTDEQNQINEANMEEARLRQNIATLKGSTEEKPLTKRYTSEILAQEDKLEKLQSQHDATSQQKLATQKTLADQIQSMQSDIKISAPDAKGLQASL